MMDIEIVMKLPREDIISLADAVDYAVSERGYEASCTTDEEDRNGIEACMDEWGRVLDILHRHLGWK